MSQVVSFSLTDSQCKLLAKLGDSGSTSLVCKNIVVQHLSSLSNIAGQDEQDTVDAYIAKRFDSLLGQLSRHIESEVRSQVEHLTASSNIVHHDGVIPISKPKNKGGRPKKIFASS